MLLRRPRNPLPPANESSERALDESLDPGPATGEPPADAPAGEASPGDAGESKATPADPATRHTIEAD
jgi:hypothetical protein